MKWLLTKNVTFEYACQAAAGNYAVIAVMQRTALPVVQRYALPLVRVLNKVL